MDTERKSLDCRLSPSVTNCDIYMSGSQDHLLRAAISHAIADHNETDTPQLREEIVKMMQPEIT